MPYPLAPGSARREHARAKSRALFPEAKRSSAVSFTAIAALAAGAVFAAPAAAASFEPVEVLRLDFQDGTTSFEGDGGYFTNVVDPLDPEGDNLVLQSDVTADWNGLQIPGSFFTPGGTYRVEAQVLDGDTGGSSRFVGQTDENAHAWIGDTPINDEAWTAVTGPMAITSPKVCMGTGASSMVVACSGGLLALPWAVLRSTVTFTGLSACWSK